MSEYVPPRVRAWRAISEKDKEIINEVINWADSIDELDGRTMKLLINIYNKLPDDIKDEDEEDEDNNNKLDFMDEVINANTDGFEDKQIDNKDKVNKLNEWLGVANTQDNQITKTIAKNYKAEAKENNKYIDEIDKLVLPYKVLHFDKIINNEYNTNDIDNVMSKLKEIRSGFMKTKGDKEKNKRGRPNRVVSYINQSLETLYKDKKIINGIISNNNEVVKNINEKGYDKAIDKLADHIQTSVQVPNNKKLSKLDFIVGDQKGEQYKDIVKDIRTQIKSLFAHKYNPNKPIESEPLSEVEQKRKSLIDSFESLSEEDKQKFIKFIPRFNTSTKSVQISGDDELKDTKTIFAHLLGNILHKKRDDITAEDKRDAIKTIGDYIYSKAPKEQQLPGFSNLLNESIFDVANKQVNSMFNPLMNLSISPKVKISATPNESIDDIEKLADDFDDGWASTEPVAQEQQNDDNQNENNNIVNEPLFDQFPGNTEEEEDKAIEEDIKEVDNMPDFTGNEGNNNTEENKSISKNEPQNNEIQEEAPTEPNAIVQANEQVQSIPNAQVPAVMTNLAGLWFDKDKTMADVLEDTQKIITLLTDEQYDKIEDGFAEQLTQAADDAGNRLFTDKQQAIKFLRSLRNKHTTRYKLPVPLEKIEHKNNNLYNVNISPMAMRMIRPLTKSYKFYNE